MNGQTTRPAAVAGMFYPADPRTLCRTVDAMVDEAPAADASSPVRMILSPHAGYPYSGAVAAAGFRRLRAQDVDTIVLIGPSHVEAFDFTSVFTGEAYETPIGSVPIDRDLALRVAGSHDTIRGSLSGHIQPGLMRGEHGLEVQLPFLQRTQPHARIVPIVMGIQDWEHCNALGESLRTHCGEDTVILASSDLSHFYDYDTARALDAEFMDTLSRLDPAALHDAVRNRRCEACGAGPVVASLIATGGGDERYHELARANSGDVTGDRSSVVGYASAVVSHN
jgi:AmmeMemoRadiSam system protein B